MGLDIYGKVSKKEYHLSYSGLHLVRWLALLVCGLPKEICGDTSFTWATSPFLHGYVMKGKELPSPELMRTILWSFQQVGYLFPNLMFHSDCDGTYTKTGKVLQNHELLTGNSIGLLKELEDLKEELKLNPDLVDKESRAIGVFNTLYDLVQDEVKNGKAHLSFR